MKLVGLLCALFCVATSYAGRMLEMPPVSQEAAFGGMVGGMGCQNGVTGFVAPGFTEAPRFGMLRWDLAMTNVSTLPQTARLVVWAGSKVTGSDSNGGTWSAPANNLSDAVVNSNWESPSYTWAPGETYTFYLSAQCAHVGGCSLRWGGPDGTTITGFSGAQNSVCNTLPPQSCLSVGANLRFRVLISEDRGAMVGNLSVLAHRCGGLLTSFGRPPYQVDVNGGRPF